MKSLLFKAQKTSSAKEQKVDRLQRRFIFLIVAERWGTVAHPYVLTQKFAPLPENSWDYLCINYVCSSLCTCLSFAGWKLNRALFSSSCTVFNGLFLWLQQRLKNSLIRKNKNQTPFKSYPLINSLNKKKYPSHQFYIYFFSKTFFDKQIYKIIFFKL